MSKNGWVFFKYAYNPRATGVQSAYHPRPSMICQVWVFIDRDVPGWCRDGMRRIREWYAEGTHGTRMARSGTQWHADGARTIKQITFLKTYKDPLESSYKCTNHTHQVFLHRLGSAFDMCITTTMSGNSIKI